MQKGEGCMRVRGARLCGLKGARVCAGIMQSWALQEEERVQEGEGCLSVRGARLRECVRSKVVRVERGKGVCGNEVVIGTAGAGMCKRERVQEGLWWRDKGVRRAGQECERGE